MKRAIGIAVLLVLAAAYAGAQTHNALMTPKNVSNSPTYSRWGQVAMTPDGVAHIVWIETPNQILYSRYDTTGFSAPFKVKGPGAVPVDRPHIAATSTGKILVVWDDNGACMLREYDNGWREPFVIAPTSWGTDQPMVTGDSQGNVYVIFGTGGMRIYSRSRINGVWSGIVQISAPRSKFASIICGPDDVIWASWMEKAPNGDYKTTYRKRTAATLWTDMKKVNPAGYDQDRPWLAMAPDGTPWFVWGDVSAANNNQAQIWVCKLDEENNPREKVLAARLQHYARMTIDANGVKHIAVQVGPGEGGIGVDYLNNSNANYLPGAWNMPPIHQENSERGPKLPSIWSVGKQVVLVWGSVVATGNKDIFVATRYPIGTGSVAPAKNLSATVEIPASQDSAKYTLKWETAGNDISYKILKKEGGAYATVTTLAPGTLTYVSESLPITATSKNLVWAIQTTVSGQTGGINPFPLTLSSTKAPKDPVAKVIYSLRNATKLSYRFFWTEENATNFVRTYKLYQKISNKWTTVATYAGNVTSFDFEGSPDEAMPTFGISAVSVYGPESAIVEVSH